jgi:hypothetical protein
MWLLRCGSRLTVFSMLVFGLTKFLFFISIAVMVVYFDTHSCGSQDSDYVSECQDGAHPPPAIPLQSYGHTAASSAHAQNAGTDILLPAVHL